MTFRCAGRRMGGLKVRRWSKSNRVWCHFDDFEWFWPFFLRWSYVISNGRISVTCMCFFCFFRWFWMVCSHQEWDDDDPTRFLTSNFRLNRWWFLGTAHSKAWGTARNSQEFCKEQMNSCTHLSFGWDLDQESHNQKAIRCIRIHRYAHNLLRTCPLNWLIHLK